MKSNLPVNKWLHLGQGGDWWPNQQSESAAARCFLFHLIRPLLDLQHIDIGTIRAKQNCMVINVRDGKLFCLVADLGQGELGSADQFFRLQNSGLARPFNMTAGNLFGGAWEAFNGPNPICSP